MARRRSRNERYHDRAAPRYEDQHQGDPYLSFCREITWRHLKRHLPEDPHARVLDAGCGPGHFGIRLAKTGYRVDFLDLSAAMLEQARRAFHASGLRGEPRFVHADLCDPVDLEPGYRLVCAIGDVLSFVDDAARALRACARLLAPGGVLFASVDQRYAGLEHYLERGDIEALERFARTGRTQWLAKRRDERFPTRSFTEQEIRALFRGAGFEVVSVLGRTVLPLHRHRALLLDPAARRRLRALEEKLNRDPSALGRASHLEVAGRLPS